MSSNTTTTTNGNSATGSIGNDPQKSMSRNSSMIGFIMDKLSMMLSIGMSVIVFYSVFIKGIDNLLSVHMFSCITWLVIISLSCCYDDILTYFVRNKETTKTTNTIIPSCSVEYNEQILFLIGFITYTVLAALLFYSLMAAAATGPTSVSLTVAAAVTANRTNDDDHKMIDFMKDSYEFFRRHVFMESDINDLSMNYTMSTRVSYDNKVDPMSSSPSFASCLVYWYYIFGIMAQHQNIVNMYTEFFGRNYHRVTSLQQSCQYPSLKMKLEEKLMIPISFLCMIFIQKWESIQSYVLTSPARLSYPNVDYYIMMIVNTTLLVWISHKLLQYGSYFFQKAQSLSISSLWTIPPYLMESPIAPILEKTDWQQQSSDIITKVEIMKESQAQSSPPENVWKIYGNVYDLTSFVPYHPGGKEAIMLGANRGPTDCTALFQSYHPFNIAKAKAILAKYQIKTPHHNDMNDDTKNRTQKEEEEKKSDDIVASNIPTAYDFSPNLYHENDIFYSILCQRVQDEMKRQYNFDMIKDSRAPLGRWLWYLFLIMGTFASCYAHCIGSIFGSLLFGVFGVLLGAMGHDGGHFAVSHSPLLNDLAVWAMSIIVNPIMWQHQHTYGHHQFTNHQDHDPDLHHFDGVMTVNIKETNDTKMKAPLWLRVYTYVYVVALFSASTVGLTFWGPVRFVIDRSQFGIVEWTDRKRWVRTFGFMFHWTLFTVLMLVVPFYAHETTMNALIAIATYYLVSGSMFGFITQVGHLNDYSLNRPLIEENRKKRHHVAQHSWAADQIEHSNNYCPQNMMIFLACIGLGLQIEHHLFPGVNHCHLMKIQPIVQQVCKEYNVSYKSYNSFVAAVLDCLQYMTRCAAQNLGYQ